MSKSLFIGVDIGTQGVKAAVYDLQGRCVAEAFRKSDLKRPSPGAVEEDPEFQLASVCQAVRECVEQAGSAGLRRRGSPSTARWPASSAWERTGGTSPPTIRGWTPGAPRTSSGSRRKPVPRS